MAPHNPEWVVTSHPRRRRRRRRTGGPAGRLDGGEVACSGGPAAAGADQLAEAGQAVDEPCRLSELRRCRTAVGQASRPDRVVAEPDCQPQARGRPHRFGASSAAGDARSVRPATPQRRDLLGRARGRPGPRRESSAALLVRQILGRRHGGRGRRSGSGGDGAAGLAGSGRLVARAPGVLVP